MIQKLLKTSDPEEALVYIPTSIVSTLNLLMEVFELTWCSMCLGREVDQARETISEIDLSYGLNERIKMTVSKNQGSHLIFGCHIMILMTLFIDFMTNFMTFFF
jgi:hypothetical protein